MTLSHTPDSNMPSTHGSEEVSDAVLQLQIAIDHHLSGRLQEAEFAYQMLIRSDPKNAEALCLFGVLAQQVGNSEVALECMRAALTLKPENALFLSTLANTLRELRQYAESADWYQRALAIQADDLNSWLNFGSVLQQLRRYTDATNCYQEILKRDPNFPEAHNDLGVALLALQKNDEAMLSFQRALKLRPEYAEAHNNLGVIYKNDKKYDEAMDCYYAALRYKPDYAKALFNLGTIYFVKKNNPLALKWYQQALQQDPYLLEAHQNVASILLDQGQLEQAQHHRDCAYKKQPILIDSVEHPIKTVVILWAAGKGNIPIEFLWPKACYTRIVCMMEYVSDEQMQTLPDYDLVFNAIGDSDVTGPTQAAVDRFIQVCRKPFLNAPIGVTNTARDQIPALFSDISDVVCPPTLRAQTAQFKEQVLLSNELRFPMIVRPGGSHGGDHLVKLESVRALQELDLFNSAVYYASNYVDYLSSDAYFRKYRIAFVDRQPYPYHMAIGKHWIVHYETADMLTAEWKRAEELAFLNNPRAALGDKAMDAIEKMGLAMNLDFCGVDFTLLPDGRVLVFEANATMLIHPEDEGGILQYKNIYVQKIFDAFNQLIARLTA